MCLTNLFVVLGWPGKQTCQLETVLMAFNTGLEKYNSTVGWQAKALIQMVKREKIKSRRKQGFVPAEENLKRSVYL